jgi:hypothetical protein
MTDITYNGKEVVKMEIQDDGECVWFIARTKDGKTYCSQTFKGEV